MKAPIGESVAAEQALGRSILQATHMNKRRHRTVPNRVLYPRMFAYVCWFLVVLWVGVTVFAWIAFDSTSDIGDLRMRWAMYPFGVPGALGLLMYYNMYVESYGDHLVYRTWLRRVRRIDYQDISANRVSAGFDVRGGIWVWTHAGKRAFLQYAIFDLEPLVVYLTTHDVHDRTKKRKYHEMLAEARPLRG